MRELENYQHVSLEAKCFSLLFYLLFFRDWNTVVQYHTIQCLLIFCNTYHRQPSVCFTEASRLKKMGKFPGVGTHKLSKCPGVGTKKEGKCPAPGIVAFQHFCSFFLKSVNRTVNCSVFLCNGIEDFKDNSTC